MAHVGLLLVPLRWWKCLKACAEVTVAAYRTLT